MEPSHAKCSLGTLRPTSLYDSTPRLHALGQQAALRQKVGGKLISRKRPHSCLSRPVAGACVPVCWRAKWHTGMPFDNPHGPVDPLLIRCFPGRVRAWSLIPCHSLHLPKSPRDPGLRSWRYTPDKWRSEWKLHPCVCLSHCSAACGLRRFGHDCKRCLSISLLWNNMFAPLAQGLKK